MYQLTKNKNKIFDQDRHRIIYRGTVEWRKYVKWLREGNKPLPSDDRNLSIKPLINSVQWDELDECKTISSIKNWLKKTLK